MKRALLFLLVSFALLWIAGCGSTTAFNPPPAGQTQLAFLQQPTPTPSAGAAPNMAGPANDVKVMVMNLDGSGQTQVGPSGAYMAVDISHDGGKAAFIEYDSELSMTQLYVANVATVSAQNITPDGTAPEMPEFSPDGTKIYFVNTNSDDWELWSVNPDGTGATNLAQLGVCMHEVTVAPSGKLYFHAHSEAGSGMYSMNADGSSLQMLIEDSAYHPSVTEDGAKLVFELSGDGSYIATANLDGTNVQTLGTGGNDEDPVVVGDKIFFISNPDGNPEVYSMNLDGTSRTRLTNNTANDWFGEFWD